MSDKTPYRLGLTLGRKALGWCVLDLDGAGRPTGIRDLGVRVFSPNQAAGRDASTGEPLGKRRREARKVRRRYRRVRQRKAQLMVALIEAGLMPEDRSARETLVALDAYELRKRALTEPLSPFAVGRAIWHLNRRRGVCFDRRADRDGTETEAAIERLRQAMDKAGAATLGAFLAGLHAHNQANRQGDTVSVRFRVPPGSTATVPEWMPSRAMIADELKAIWQAQAAHRPELFTEAAFAAVASAVLDQRPLQPSTPGPCCLNPDEPRAPRAMPGIERLELLSALANLELDYPGIGTRPLTQAQRDRLSDVIEDRRGLVRFGIMRKALEVPDAVRFVSERQGGRGIEPMRLSVGLAAILGAAWRAMPLDERNALAAMVIEAETMPDLDDALAHAYGWMTAAQREGIAGLTVPRGHSRFGLTAAMALIPILEGENIALDRAVEQLAAGKEGNALAEDRCERLPHYREVAALRVDLGSGERRDRVADPSLHIGLNQMRRVVNALIDRHGPPARIVVELDKALKQSRVAAAIQRRAVKRSDALEAAHRAWLDAKGIATSWENRLKLRLFEELPENGKECVYTGRPLDREALFFGGVVIDRVLPWHLTLDDSLANKVLCCASVVDRKRDRLAVDAFGGPDAAEFHAVTERAERLLPGKAWRFRPDAMARLEKSGPALGRHLADRQPMARTVRRYLEAVCPYPRVSASPGRLRRWLKHRWGIAALPGREGWGLREKAVDAAIAAALDTGLLQALADGLPDGPVPQPFAGFTERLGTRIADCLVSHRPDREPNGALHRETAFGPVDAEIDGKPFNLVLRRPVGALTPRDLARVRDLALREALTDLAGREGWPLADSVTLPELGATVSRVRVLETGEAVTVRHGPDGRFAKAFQPHGNHAVDILEEPDGRWRGKAVTLFEAAGGASGDGGRWVMRLHKGDTVRMEPPGEMASCWIVRKLDPNNNRIGFVPQDAAGPFAPSDYRHLTYSRMQAYHVRRAEISVLGEMRPGTGKKPAPAA